MLRKARNAPCLDTTKSAAVAKAMATVHLTPRQREVLGLLCEGLPNKVICRRLDISAGTGKAHIAAILRELGVSSRLQAVIAAHRLGLRGDDPERSAETEKERAESRLMLQLTRVDEAEAPRFDGAPQLASFGRHTY